MRAEIIERLDQIEASHGARILLAIESGSRAWGFPSPDSDWDVRFIYAMPPEHYLQVRDRRDVIEQVDGLLDLSGWDVRKAIRLLLKSNASAVEWLRSPVVYRETAEAEILRRFASNASIGGLQRHYYHLANSIWRERFEAGKPVILKKYFYLLRPALALRYIRRKNEAPPMDMPSLLGGAQLDVGTESIIAALIARKAKTRELDGGARLTELDQLCLAELDAATALMGPEKPPTEAQYSEADAVFRQCIGYAS